MNFKVQAHSFLDKVFDQLEKYQVDIKNWEIDHLCYRTSSEDNYLSAKEEFNKLGVCLTESEVNGRLIATYKLNKPVFYKKWIIDLVEVPAPKPNKETPEGLEHLEIVVDEAFEEIQKNNPNISFSTKGLGKELNPELEVKFEDCAIKFHHKSLEHIINIEENTQIASFLKESEILSSFKEFEPNISGTLPLGIQHADSDLDILFISDDLDAFVTKTTERFGKCKRFAAKIVEHQGRQSAVINFDFQNLPIELFCQNRNVFQQQANQHFLIEGRLLKVLGKDFKKKIVELKKDGIKTEPAFGQILGLSNPYADLIDLNKLSDMDLYNRFKIK